MSTIAPSLTVLVSEEVGARVHGLFVETATAGQLSASKSAPHLDDAIGEILSCWYAKSAADLERRPEFVLYRELHRRFSDAFGAVIPAVENLVTRYLSKGKFPHINSLVDAANVASLRNLIPVGLFDLHAIAGGLTLEIASGGETIVPLGKSKSETVPRGFAVLRDSEKVISMVGVRDSAQTMITDKTTDVLAFSWGIEGISRDSVRDTLADCIALCKAGGARA